MAKKPRRIMREFVIKELSAVDRPAQAGALMTIMKRDDSLDKAIRKTAEHDGHSHMYDDSESGRTSTDDGHDHPVVVKADGTVEIGPGGSDGHTHAEGDVPMTAAEKKQLDELQKKLDDLNKGATADVQAMLKEVTSGLADLTKRLEAADAEKKILVAKASMSDAEKAHYDSISKDDEKEEFLEMTEDDRKKKMKKTADAKAGENPVVYKSDRTGEEFRKNDDPRLVKYAKQADEDAEIAKTERTKREDAEYSKRADDTLKIFSDDVAKRDDKIAILRAVDKMDEGPRAALLKMLEVGGKAISAAFDKIGHSREDVAKTAGDFNKRVDEIMSRDKITKLAALEKAEKEFPNEFKAYQESGAVVSRSN